MKIYFAGSIRGGRGDQKIYRQLIEYIKTFGEVLTEHLGDQKLSALGEQDKDVRVIHDRDLAWIQEAEVVIAEVTTPSLGVGYEIARAEDWGKKILCLYRPEEGKSLSPMVAGSDRVALLTYNSIEEAQKILDDFLGGKK